MDTKLRNTLTSLLWTLEVFTGSHPSGHRHEYDSPPAAITHSALLWHGDLSHGFVTTKIINSSLVCFYTVSYITADRYYFQWNWNSR